MTKPEESKKHRGASNITLKDIVETLMEREYENETGKLIDDDNFRLLAEFAGVKIPTQLEREAIVISKASQQIGSSGRTLGNAITEIFKIDQQRRDEIVERANRDIDELRDYKRIYFGNGLYKVFSAAGLSYACFADFIVNREKRTVVALLRGYQSGKVRARGIAKCHPDDCFNDNIGKSIALRRALNLEVPDEYLNAPQPTEVRVGDIVETYIHGYPERYVVVGTDKEVEEKDGSCHIESIIVNYFPVKTKVIDDSREGVAELES